MILEKEGKVGPTKWFEVWTKLYDFTGLLANETLYRHHRVACSTEAFATQQMTAVTKIERDLFPEHGTAVVAAFITSYPLGHFQFASTHYLSRQQLNSHAHMPNSSIGARFCMRMRKMISQQRSRVHTS